MKDFYDIWFLSQFWELDEEVLTRAIKSTFDNRGTKIDFDSIVFTPSFLEDPNKAKQWKAFVRKRELSRAPSTFHEVAESVLGFLRPLLKGASKLSGTWS